MYNELASDWLVRRGKLNFFEDKNVKSSAGFFKIKTSGNRAEGPCDIPADNRAGATDTGDDIRGNTYPRKNTNRTYTFKTYSEEAKLKINPVPKESNFSKDKEKDKVKNKRFVDSPTQNQRMRNIDGIGPQYDTRQQGTVYPMSGLGDVTYREQKEFSSFRKFREAIDDPGAVDMGVGGTLGGATNKEPLQTYKDADRNIGIQIKKKKK
jgi:hypothetical protein